MRQDCSTYILYPFTLSPSLSLYSIEYGMWCQVESIRAMDMDVMTMTMRTDSNLASDFLSRVGEGCFP